MHDYPYIPGLPQIPIAYFGTYVLDGDLGKFERAGTTCMPSK
jgi:hypothetical protein